jgi:hypothetical protein
VRRVSIVLNDVAGAGAVTVHAVGVDVRHHAVAVSEVIGTLYALQHESAVVTAALPSSSSPAPLPASGGPLAPARDPKRSNEATTAGRRITLHAESVAVHLPVAVSYATPQHAHATALFAVVPVFKVETTSGNTHAAGGQQTVLAELSRAMLCTVSASDSRDARRLAVEKAEYLLSAVEKAEYLLGTRDKTAGVVVNDNVHRLIPNLSAILSIKSSASATHRKQRTKIDVAPLHISVPSGFELNRVASCLSASMVRMPSVPPSAAPAAQLPRPSPGVSGHVSRVETITNSISLRAPEVRLIITMPNDSRRDLFAQELIGFRFDHRKEWQRPQAQRQGSHWDGASVSSTHHFMPTTTSFSDSESNDSAASTGTASSDDDAGAISTERSRHRRNSGGGSRSKPLLVVGELRVGLVSCRPISSTTNSAAGEPTEESWSTTQQRMAPLVMSIGDISELQAAPMGTNAGAVGGRDTAFDASLTALTPTVQPQHQQPSPTGPGDAVARPLCVQLRVLTKQFDVDSGSRRGRSSRARALGLVKSSHELTGSLQKALPCGVMVDAVGLVGPVAVAIDLDRGLGALADGVLRPIVASIYRNRVPHADTAAGGNNGTNARGVLVSPTAVFVDGEIDYETVTAGAAGVAMDASASASPAGLGSGGVSAGSPDRFRSPSSQRTPSPTRPDMNESAVAVEGASPTTVLMPAAKRVAFADDAKADSALLNSSLANAAASATMSASTSIELITADRAVYGEQHIAPGHQWLFAGRDDKSRKTVNTLFLSGANRATVHLTVPGHNLRAATSSADAIAASTAAPLAVSSGLTVYTENIRFVVFFDPRLLAGAVIAAATAAPIQLMRRRDRISGGLVATLRSQMPSAGSVFHALCVALAPARSALVVDPSMIELAPIAYRLRELEASEGVLQPRNQHPQQQQQQHSGAASMLLFESSGTGLTTEADPFASAPYSEASPRQRQLTRAVFEAAGWNPAANAFSGATLSRVVVTCRLQTTVSLRVVADAGEAAVPSSHAPAASTNNNNSTAAGESAAVETIPVVVGSALDVAIHCRAERQTIVIERAKAPLLYTIVAPKPLKAPKPMTTTHAGQVNAGAESAPASGQSSRRSGSGVAKSAPLTLLVVSESAPETLAVPLPRPPLILTLSESIEAALTGVSCRWHTSAQSHHHTAPAAAAAAAETAAAFLGPSILVSLAATSRGKPTTATATATGSTSYATNPRGCSNSQRAALCCSGPSTSSPVRSCGWRRHSHTSTAHGATRRTWTGRLSSMGTTRRRWKPTSTTTSCWIRGPGKSCCCAALPTTSARTSARATCCSLRPSPPYSRAASRPPWWRPDTPRRPHASPSSTATAGRQQRERAGLRYREARASKRQCPCSIRRSWCRRCQYRSA